MTCASTSSHTATTIEKGAGMGTGVGVDNSEASSLSSGSMKRKHSAVVSSTPGEFDLSLLDSPRPGRPSRMASQDPAMQEARKRARVLRNRAAAQQSREKKRQHMEGLEQENSELRAKNEELGERLSKAEESNADLSARLDSLSQQLQSLQTLLLNTQEQRQAPQKTASLPISSGHSQQQKQQQLSLSPSMLNWSSLTPLAVSPLHTPLHSAQTCVSNSPSNPTFAYTNATTNTLLTPSSHRTFASAAAGATPSSTPALDVSSSSNPILTTNTVPQNIASNGNLSGSSLLSAMTDAIAATSPSLKPSAAMGILSSSVAASDFSGKDLSESAALEQSGTHIYCVVPDSQQRMPLPHTENIYRNQQPQMRSLEATLEAYSSTSSSKNWGQRMSNLAVAVVMSASPQSSPQALWTIFCALWWIISQSGGWISKYQISRIARGILESPQQQQHQQVAANSVSALLSKSVTAGRSRVVHARPDDIGFVSLALLATWLSSGSRTGAALRRVVGSEAVDKVSALVVELRVTARSISSRKQHRLRSSGAACNKQKLFSPP
ncbi:hypothetical protein GGI25_000806 [Coemansia spiralis]|uniref:BZIP domain-containing protein n=2 Tax=Coemansia TaxID=4863 RepID=A0A9W8L024_9FUNG|nr:hypothetical protein EDC05_005297 [Coemansia umbellata]KAJ2621072.1 hypothetical protein GGI26_004416 [Coemansia sp. RSA 1358]KAJ2680213.1 hypothetical protein GGI25_000806 [Coemansia spiralis]